MTVETLTLAVRYSLVLTWDDQDRIYVASCPELPGCNTHAATRAEALANGEQAIAEWLDIAAEQGWIVPAPRVYGDVAVAV